ncbi:MAG: GDP-mannose 4,6-dehydratase, partial [Cryomorphaceae bacterium]
AYDLFAVNGILFNHESPLRGETFLTRKVTRAVARIKLGLQERLFVGNLDAKRDWGHARDYVEGMWLMLQQNEPEDFVLATGKTYSVRFFIETAFSNVGIKIKWRGEKENEEGFDEKTDKVLIKVDKKYYRPTEVDLLVGDPTKAQEKLKWKHKYNIEDLISEMVESDLELFKRDKYLLDGGHAVLNYNE